MQCNLTACFELPPAADTELQPQRSGGEGTVLLAGPAVLRGVGGLLVLLQRPLPVRSGQDGMEKRPPCSEF